MKLALLKRECDGGAGELPTLDDAIASVPLGSRAYADALARAKIPYRLDTFAGGHTDRTRQRFEQRVLPYFAQQFSGAAPNGNCTP